MPNNNIVIVSFSNRGAHLSKRIEETLIKENYIIDNYTYYKYSELNNLKSFNSIKELVKKEFNNYAYWIFIGALGIAVREIAPYIKHKSIDPAVIVLDEGGNFVISTLSGHIGGANDMTRLISEKLNITPVITTATDINHKFSIDSYAVKHDLIISNYEIFKELASHILVEPIKYQSDFEIINKVPDDLNNDTSYTGGIYITYQDFEPFNPTLHLIPRVLNVGIGCKKGTSKDTIYNELKRVFKENHLLIKSIKNIVSIDLKKEETGLIELSKDLNVPFVTFTKEELMNQDGDYSYSEFVFKTTGVDCVCERSATIINNSKLLIKKNSNNGVTISIGLENIKIEF